MSIQDLDAIRARAEAATYCGGDMQELADDALALLDEVERVGPLAKKWYGEKAVAEAEVERLRNERDQAREECGHEKHMRKFVSDERDRFIAAKMRAEAEQDRLAATVDRVEKLAELLTEQGDEHVSGCMGQADCAKCVQIDLRAAIEGTDS